MARKPAGQDVGMSCDSLRRIRVLIADDRAMIREVLALILDSDADLEIIGHAANGQEAARLTEALNPDVVLMNAAMPAMDGAEATARISRVCPAVSVIGMGLCDSENRREPMLAAGALGFFEKRIALDKLITAIKRHGRTARILRAFRHTPPPRSSPCSPQ